MNRSTGTAPNKPILLLSIIELISRGEIRKNQIPLSGELVATFMNVWRYLEPNRKPDIGQPFFYLRSDGFWHFQPNPGFELAITSKAKLVSAGAIKQAVEYAYLDDELWQILQDSHNRSVLTQVLIDEWFSINDDYSIIVMDGLREEAPNCKPMRQFVGEQIILPAQQQYYPRVEALRWHRENIFNAA
ncbi:hypothetical protein DSM106972_018340 [Dulcicalothrix desertica PCC 7102]|uniref:ScoMcrA-like DNA sulfur-binding domain-containing protein n=1 Tax=Dulcicalothrix desertica PCC 7102 TaxID=232991 RepID=A0A433VN84_9CYAN|nr:hypothetical protein [Dulcicalothrix desertica]RUT07574.1 hypothetical protein DSM106972_018340 [Dulcicalothrix desertica PCC 7102]TWH39743.1 putative restriction endonuclease [Dulcicalothrix desertica PCC 7102]